MLMSESKAGKLSTTPQRAHNRELLFSSDASSSSAKVLPTHSNPVKKGYHGLAYTGKH